MLAGGALRGPLSIKLGAYMHSAAINLWLYEWRDVAVSCPVLTEEERKQLSRLSSPIKIVCLDEFHATDRTRVPDSLGVR